MDLFNELKKMNILLIDDDRWIRDSLNLFFESEDCRIEAVETAEEGLEAIGKASYDIIIVDYCLPGMDGFEFLKKVRDKMPGAIRILITAYSSKSIMDEASRMGIHYFISKPFSSKTIESALAQLIEHRKRLISEF